MMIIKRHFILVVVGLLFSAASLCAAPIDFTPELNLSVEYTDNLLLAHGDTEKVDDFITTAGISLTTDINGRTAGFEINYSPSYIMFADNDTLDYFRQEARLRLWNAFKRNTRLELNSTFLESEDPRDQSVADDGDGTIGDPAIGIDLTRRDRNRYRRFANELRLSHQFGSKNEFFGAVSYDLSRDIDRPAGDELDDYDAIQPEFGLEYWFGQNFSLTLDAYASDRDYEERNDRIEYFGSIRFSMRFSRRLSGYIQYQYTALDYDIETINDDYTISAPSAGFEYALTQDSNLSIGAGYYEQDMNANEDDSGSFIDAEINKRWAYIPGYIEIAVSSGYDIEDTGSEDLGLQIYYEGRAEAGYNFTSRLAGELTASYRNDDYPNQTSSGRTDQTINAGASLSYQALRWMQFELAYNYENVISDLETEEFIENSVIFTITMVPSRPFRKN